MHSKLLGVVSCLVVIASPALAEEMTFRLDPGGVQVVEFKGVKRIAVGDPSIAEVRVVEGAVLVIGRDEGKTTLLVWTQDGERSSHIIEVTGKRESKRAAPNAQQPGAAPTAQLKVGAERVLLFPGLTRVSVSDPTVLDIQHQGGGKLRLIPIREGLATVCTWGGQGDTKDCQVYQVVP